MPKSNPLLININPAIKADTDIEEQYFLQNTNWDPISQNQISGLELPKQNKISLSREI